MKLVVQDAENIQFDGEVDRITSFNEVGRFDIYPMHSNFISIIQKELSLYKGNQKLKEFKIEQAILKAKQDIVTIFLGIDTLQVDEEKAAADKPKSPQQPPQEPPK
jgi:F0F1-type ATP synthase epsilon subunit